MIAQGLFRTKIVALTTVMTFAAAFVATGCATEIIELDSPSTTVDGQVDGTISPSISSDATLAELTVVLRNEVDLLGQAIFVTDRDAAREHLVNINTAWAYIEPLIVAQYGELADQLTYDLQRVIELARSAVERNRPADAGKANAFLRLALASLDVQ
jgi:predicted lipoprotein